MDLWRLETSHAYIFFGFKMFSSLRDAGEIFKEKNSKTLPLEQNPDVNPERIWKGQKMKMLESQNVAVDFLSLSVLLFT